MARYFFDVQIGEVTESDRMGSELPSSDSITGLALDLCLQIAREHLPGHSRVWVRVREGEGAMIYESRLTLSGSWI